MFSKCLLVVVFLASTSAQYHHATTSPAVSSDFQYPVPHIAVAPAITKYAVPTAHTQLAIPLAAKYAAPSASSYFSSPVHAAPLAKVSVPVLAKYTAVPQDANVAAQEEYAHPKYEYTYSVEDYHTGDAHSQQEQRDGDHVVGQYSLHEPDGTIRIVKYYEDGHGFNVVVEKQGTPTEASAAKNIAPASIAARHYQ